jgi:transcriptional regulator with XRE-family HTH domain
MDAATIIKTARQRAGLSVRATARRAGTSASTLCAYESGASIPSFATLNRIVNATGNRLTVALQEQTPDEQRAKEIEQLLRFADQVPLKKSGPLRYPPLADMVKR